ncbi:MAG: CpaF family protein [Clostridia bacterium]|nr:CpaF family protein [Clostridia bacterium]
MLQADQDLNDEQSLSLTENYLVTHSALKCLTPRLKRRVVRLVFCSLRRELEILQDIADDPEVTEIMVNGCENIFIERKGHILRADVTFENSKELERVIQRLAARVGREMNELNPIVDARLEDGSRINAVNKNIAVNGPILTIRKFNRSYMSMQDLIQQNDITLEAADLLKSLVECGYNMFVSGGTSSGKTTFLNILSDFIPSNERVIVIEDSAELAIRNHENLVRMEAKNANAQGKGAVTIRDLIKTSLRMRPDRIIVGEVRGGEVVDMLAAMSTGHDGSLSTGHANSPEGMLGRLETMFLSASNFPIEAVRSQIAEAIDIFIHLSRTKDGKRHVMEITEVVSYENGKIHLNKLFRYEQGKGLISTGNTLLHIEKLALH